MSNYLVRRLLIAIPTLIIISIVVYGILALAPGDPLSQFAANPDIPPDVRLQIRHEFGLDQPVPVRYAKWALAFVHGDWGYSFQTRSPVSALIMQRLPTDFAVIGFAYLVSVLLAIPIGVIAGIKQYSWFDHIATTFAFVGFSLPTFFTGVLLILIFSVHFGWLPSIYNTDTQQRSEVIKQMIMPIAVLALFQTASLTRYTRASVLDNIRGDYVRTARAKGLVERIVVMRHIVRNSLIPVVTLMALQLPAVFTGAVVTEQIFRVPGIGSLLISAIENSDTPVVMAITFVFAILVVLFNLIADLVYGFLDPRIKYA